MTRPSAHRLPAVYAFLFLHLLFLSFRTNAQHYNFAATAGTFTAVSGSTAVDFIEADDAISSVLPIGFTFTYFGQSYTSFAMSSNGYITFDAVPADENSNDLQFNTDLFIAPLWDDLNGGGGAASYALTGSAPNRVLTVEWLNWRWNYLAATGGISFQVKLYETTNKIEFIYRQEAGALNSPGASIGLTGDSFNEFYSLSNSSASPELSVEAVDNITTKPATGQIYGFTPGTAPAAPTIQASNITTSAVGPNSATISWTNGNGSRRLVFFRTTTFTFGAPSVTNGDTYYGGAAYGDGNVDDTFGWLCVYNGTGNSVNVSNLISGNTYRVAVFEYNGLAGNQAYNIAAATNNPANFTTQLVAPSTPVSTISIQWVGSTQMDYEIEKGDGAKHVVFVKAGSATTAPIVDNTTYTANSTFGSGSQVGTTGWYCVFNGATIASSVSGLSPGTLYTIYMVDYNGSSGSEKYNVASVTNNPVEFTTFTSPAVLPYTFSASSGTFTPLTSGTALDVIEDDDAVSDAIPIGFTFRFSGIPFTQVYASANGFLTFNKFAGNDDFSLMNDLDFGDSRPAIAPLWDDLMGSAGQASYTTTGIAPNRIFTIEYLNYEWIYNALDPGISFQIKLYETTNAIQFVYRQETGSINQPSASIGLAFLDKGTFLSVDGSGTSPTVSSATETSNIATKPATGQTYTFTPSKANQTITFGALAAKNYGNAPFALTGTVSSGLPITYTSSNTAVATISGSTVTIVGVGTTTITAAQAGDDNYNAATSVPQTLTVSKGNQTITFNTLAAKAYGNADFALTGSASSGLTISYTSSNTAVATISGSTVTIVGVGTTTITASQAGDAFYNAATDVARTLTVNKGSQTITFNTPPTKNYGDAPFDPGATVSSGLTVTYTSSNTAVATVAGSTVTIVGVGTSIITASQAGNTNYNAATSVARVLTVSKGNQTITFGALAAKTFGDAAFTLSGTASSGLSVTYTSSNTAVATVSGNTITIVGSGSTTITAAQAGNTNYNAATSVPQTLTINKANQTITFGALTAKTFGGANFTLSATASSGLAIAYTSSNTAVATVSGNTVTIIGAGSTTITAAQAGNTNYNAATSVPQTLTVNKASQTITFAALASKAFGDANFSLGATASSGLAVTYTSSNTAVATVSGSTVTIVGVGTSTITASQAGNANYNAATAVPQTLTVTKGNQTITFNTLAAKTFGDASFSLTGTASSGLTVTYVSSNTGVATISGSTVTIVGAGTSTITASQAGNTNYNAATNVARTLTVNKASQTITFGAIAAKNFGDPSFTLSATSSSGLSITYTSSNTGVATISGNTVTIVGGGTSTITALQAGNTNYNAATSVQQTLTVNKLNQTITFGALTAKTFGDANFTLGATTTSGLAVTYTSSNTGVATVSGNTVTIVGGGTTTITAAQAGNANYNAAVSVPQTLTVNKANQTITFGALAAKSAGDANFDLAATSNSGLSIAYTSSNTSVATISGSSVTIVGVGSTTITASQAGNTDYNAAIPVAQMLTINKGSQTITFPQPADKNFGDAPFDLTATATSALAVTYTSSNPSVATVSGSTVAILGAGTTDITAVQAGDVNFNAAVNVVRTLTVNKANQVITFNAIPVKTSEDPAFALGGTSSSGLVVTYTSSNPAVATISGNTVTIVGAGTADITASQPGDANYNAAPSVIQTLVVKGNQTITFNALPSKTFGDASFSLTATASSGLTVTYISSNTAVATVSGSTVTIVGVGATDITASQAGNANFTQATSVTRTLTVSKGSQTITFAAITNKTFGDAPFTLTATSSTGLPVAFSTTSDKITISGNQVTIVKAGSVTIKADQAGNTNYNAAATAEITFCINPVKPSITASGLDTEAPVLTSSSAAGNQWFRDNAVIAGATATTFTATQAGIYAVVVSADNCSSQASESFALVVTGDEETADASIDVYPNPVEEELIIDLSSMNLTSPADISMFDGVGRVVESVSSSGKTTLDISGYKAGNYLLRIQGNDRVITKKIIKK